MCGAQPNDLSNGQQTRIDRTARWLAACGVVTPILDVLVTVKLAALDPSYSHAQQYISELGEAGRPYAAVFNSWCGVYGLLFGGFALAAGRGLRSRAVLAVLLAIAVVSVVGGIFPCDPGCLGESPAAQVHMLAGHVGLVAIFLSPLLSWFAMRKSAAWRGYQTFTLTCGVLLVGASGWLGACHYLGGGHERCPLGTVQRLILGIQYLWMVVIAMQLWRLACQQPSTRSASEGIVN
jgi:hypothetical membrane protein